MSNYTIGKLVWVELKGHCPWPGRVSFPPSDLDPPEEMSNLHCIYFFGTKKYEWVEESNLKPYKKLQHEMMKYCTLDGFMDALNQIVDYLENPEKFPELSDVEIKEEADDAMECDAYNGYELNDTSMVEHVTDKIVESCLPSLKVMLKRVTIYECEDCAVCFLKQREFEQHKLTHIEEINDEENSIETRKEHDNFNNNLNICDKIKSEKQTIICNIFDNIVKLKVRNGHIKVPTTLNPIVALDRIEARKCDLCDQHFVDPHEFRIHKMSHLERFKVTENKEFASKSYKCPKCDVRFVLKNTLDMHLNVHDRFICHCGIGYNRFTEFKEHKKLKHNEIVSNNEDITNIESITLAKNESNKKSKQKNRKCRADNETEPENKFEVSGALKDNVKTKIKQSRKLNKKNKKLNPRFSCKLCKKTFKYKVNVKSHQVIHTKERPYPCNLCEKRFTQIGALNLHLKRHAGRKDFVCQYCPKTFYEDAKRIIHERIHTGLKPYHCDYCSKKFSDPSAYNRHIRIHTGERRYECNICFTRFTEAGPLQRHKIKVHDRSKALNCSICPKIFCFAFELRKHVKVEHAD